MNVTFTRHNLTTEQLSEIGTVGLDCTDLANRSITSLEEAEQLFWGLARRIQSATPSIYTPVRVYGVIPTPLRHVLQNWSTPLGQSPSRKVGIFEAFNVQRAEEGQKPTFQHCGWLQTGTFYFPV